MSWTADYPTKPGFYWIRNYKIEGRWADEGTAPRMTLVEFDLGFIFPGNYPIYHSRDVVSAEWQGPIEPESEIK